MDSLRIGLAIASTIIILNFAYINYRLDKLEEILKDKYNQD